MKVCMQLLLEQPTKQPKHFHRPAVIANPAFDTALGVAGRVGNASDAVDAKFRLNAALGFGEADDCSEAGHPVTHVASITTASGQGIKGRRASSDAFLSDPRASFFGNRGK